MSHKNARTTPHSRALIARRVQAGETVAAVVGELADRSCRPQRSPRAISAAVLVEIQPLRQLEWTGAQIAEVVQVNRATVARTLGQLGVARLEALQARPVIQRFEWSRPGQLLHLGIKKLGRIGRIGHLITGDRRGQARGIGWECVHVCIDDCSRVAYAEVLVDEKGPTVAAFLRRAVAWFRRRAIRVQRVLTDTGSGYRFIRTMPGEWAYGLEARPEGTAEVVIDCGASSGPANVTAAS